MGAAVSIVRQRADERLANRSHQRRRGRLLVVWLELATLDALVENVDQHVPVAAAEREALGLDRRVDRLGEQCIGARGGRQSAARERLGGGGDALGRAAAVVSGRVRE